MLLALIPLSLAEPAALTAAEVARHDQPGDCWMIIDGTVYDLSGFAAAHPGGEELLRGCGKDASWYWRHRGDGQPHSQAAEALRKRFALGALGETVAIQRPPPVHPYDLRLEGSRVGLLPSAGLAPARSITLRVGHAIPTDPALEPGIDIELGYSTGWLELLVSDARAPGLGAVQAAAQPLHQQRGAPLSARVSAGGGYAAEAAAPAIFGQAVIERTWLDRRLCARASATAALSPGLADSAALSAGAGLELRPLAIHSVFGELLVPTADPSTPAWSAGLRLFTRGHTFSLYAASTPARAPYELAGPARESLTFGGAFERAFRL